jgi:hypothetical protein
LAQYELPAASVRELMDRACSGSSNGLSDLKPSLITLLIYFILSSAGPLIRQKKRQQVRFIVNLLLLGKYKRQYPFCFRDMRALRGQNRNTETDWNSSSEIKFNLLAPEFDI